MINKIVKKISHAEHTEYFITANWKKLRTDDLLKILEELRLQAVKIISITYTGNLKKFAAISGLFSSYPTTSLGDSSLGKKTGEGGIYIYGVQGREIQIKYIKEKKKIIGAYFFLPGKLEGIYVETPFDPLPHYLGSFESETLQSYETLEKILAKYGFSFKDAYRFWIYMKNINENYAALNRMRDIFFKKYKIRDYPASTGIEADFTGKHRISISLEALKTGRCAKIRVESLKSDFQCEAPIYGPKFSRAKSLTFKGDNLRKLYISGTSSVNKKGDSVLIGNYEKNVEYVLSCVANLLEKSNMTFQNIVMSRVYSKNLAIEKVFQKLYKKEKWNFPYNQVIANICRESFIFEMECIAVGNSKKAR